MKLAVTLDQETGEVFRHFGETPDFRIYEIEENRIVSSEVVSSGEYSHGALVGFLKSLGVEVLISGGIGTGAEKRLQAAGIALYGGVKGNADAAVKAYLDGSLNYDPLAAGHHGARHHSV